MLEDEKKSLKMTKKKTSEPRLISQIYSLLKSR